jgi:hypothetical protein
MKKMDMVNHPPHYTSGKIECIDYMEDVLSPEEFRGYLRGQIIKYNHRLVSKSKPGEDAGKLAWYSARLQAFMVKPVPKRRGRPVGSKNRKKVVAPEKAATA